MAQRHPTTRRRSIFMVVSLCTMMVLGQVGIGFTEEPAAAPPIAEEPSSGSVPAEDVRERGVLQLPPGLGAVPGVTINAPTPSLTTVANLLRFTHKSVSVHVDVPSGVVLEAPVEVTVSFLAGKRFQEVKQIYSQGQGIHIRHEEPEGDGLPHPVRMAIDLRELNADGKRFHHSTRDLVITPLYNVEVKPLLFKIVFGCETRLRGKNDIDFKWLSPRGRDFNKRFKLQENEGVRIEEFAWSGRDEPQTQLYEPLVRFQEWDDIVNFHPPLGPPRPLDLAPLRKLRFQLREDQMGPAQSPAPGFGCLAELTYIIQRTLVKA